MEPVRPHAAEPCVPAPGVQVRRGPGGQLLWDLDSGERAQGSAHARWPRPSCGGRAQAGFTGPESPEPKGRAPTSRHASPPPFPGAEPGQEGKRTSGLLGQGLLYSQSRSICGEGLEEGRAELSFCEGLTSCPHSVF